MSVSESGTCVHTFSEVHSRVTILLPLLVGRTQIVLCLVLDQQRQALCKVSQIVTPNWSSIIIDGGCVHQHRGVGPEDTIGVHQCGVHDDTGGRWTQSTGEMRCNQFVLFVRDAVKRSDSRITE